MDFFDDLKALLSDEPPSGQPNYPTVERLLEKLEQLRVPLTAVACRREVAAAYPEIEWQLWMTRSQWESDAGQPAPDVASASGDLRTVWSDITTCPVPEDAAVSELESMATTAASEVSELLNGASSRLESALEDGGDPDQAFGAAELANAAYERVREKEEKPTESELINSMFEHHWDDDASGEAEEQFGATIFALGKLTILAKWLGASASAQLAATTIFRLELDAALDELHRQLGERGEIAELHHISVTSLGAFSHFIGGWGLIFKGIPWIVTATGFGAGFGDLFTSGGTEVTVEKVAESWEPSSYTSAFKTAIGAAEDRRRDAIRTAADELREEFDGHRGDTGNPELIPGAGVSE